MSAVSRTDASVTVVLRDTRTGKTIKRTKLAKGQHPFAIQLRGTRRHSYALNIRSKASGRLVPEYSGTVTVR